MFSRYGSFRQGSGQNKESKSNSRDFFEAIKEGDLEKCQNILSKGAVKCWELIDEKNNTALHYSVFKNNYDLSLLVLEEVKKGYGINSSKKLSQYINSKNKEGITALHYSVMKGNIKIFNLLKKYGANLDEITNTGKNIVHLAAESNQPTMMIYLYLNEAQDISSVDENGSSPLHWACYHQAEECVNYLLNANVDINAQDKDRLTPLSIAVLNNKVNLVKLLLRKGADKNIKGKNNQLPIDIANKKHYVQIKEILSSEENYLCSLEIPNKYIEPSGSYKRIILILLIISEIIIILLVLPFLENLVFYIVNFALFLLTLISYIVLSFSEPGYQKNKNLVLECNGEEDYKCWKKLVESGEDLRKYCPVCYVLRSNDIKHCFICNKCVRDLCHHCFWFNKCIGKKNIVYYIIFVFITFIFCIYTIFICSNLIFDTVNMPYQSFFPAWFYLGIDRGFRVLGASVVSIIAMICSYPLFFLFMIEMFKLCGLLGKRNKDMEKDNGEKIEEANIDDINISSSNSIELQNKENNLIVNDNDNDENGENNNNFPIMDGKPSIVNEEEKQNLIVNNENDNENEEN